MSEVSTAGKSVDLGTIQDPATRKVFREYHDQMMKIVNGQQLQIEALLDTLIDRHMTSLGEFKHQIQKIQSHTASTNRLHEAVLSALAETEPGGRSQAR